MSYWQKQYEEYCNTPSDINEHLPVLYELASEPDVEYISEFGVGYGRSTRAFMAAIEGAHKCLYSFDIKVLDGVQELFDRTKTDLDFLSNATLFVGNNLEFPIENFKADLLLVDSHHIYEQVRDELTKFGNLVSKYIIFHDTETFGVSGQDHGSVGIMPAIHEFIAANSHWATLQRYTNNNGLLVLKRV